MKTNILDQYTDICTEALSVSGAKLAKSFEKILIEVLKLFILIQGRVNFCQMERYGAHDEQTYRNNFDRRRSESVNWLKLNAAIARRYFGEQGRWAIAIDPSYVSKSGKKTPHIGRFWSGCAQAVKHGLEIMGIGLVDIDSNNCIMLRVHQTPCQKELALRDKSQVEHYIGVIKRYHKELLKMTNLIVADAYFSTSAFVEGIKKHGFCLVSRLRDNACLYYLYDGPRTGKPGRPKTKGEKIDLQKLDFHFNASFAAVNLAKVMMKEIGMDYSMTSFKSLMFNDYMTKRIFAASGYRPNQNKISKIFKDLFGLQRKSA